MLTCAAMLILGTALGPGDPPKKSEVVLSISNVETPQAVGGPVVLELTLTNPGKDHVAWWCGGPAQYPGAEHFVVEVCYNGGQKWHAVEATNGQYTQGSGSHWPLAEGKSIQVPLAVPIEKTGVRDVQVRVLPRHWNAAKSAEVTVVVSKDRTYLDRYRARLVAAAINPKYGFERHLAEKYADEAVLETLAKMLDIDNETIVAGSVYVLARQKELPATTGESLAAAVRRWGTDDRLASLGIPRGSLFWVALNTRSEPARQAVLEFLKSPDPQLLSRTAATLCQSPGDAVWLRRVRESVAAVEKEVQKDAEAAKSVAQSLKHLDERVQKARP